MHNLQRATAAICVSILGGAMLIVAGLWPVDDWAAGLCAITGWSAFGLAVRFVHGMSEV